MKRLNSLISGSKGQLFYWVPHKYLVNQWILQQRLQENYSQRNFIQMNQFEDLLIQADGDRTVKFWKLQNDSWHLKQTVRTIQSTTIMSLNQTDEKLVTCQIPEIREPGCKFQIQVLIKKNEAKWEIDQTIGIWNETFKICFTFSDQFVFSNIKIENTDQGSLEIYDYNQEKRKFEKTRSIKIQKVDECCYFFPCQLIKSQNMLILKHGSFINIFKINNRNEIELRQTIEMKTNQYYGKLTDDGKHLVIWNGEFWGGCWKETIQIWNAIKK